MTFMFQGKQLRVRSVDFLSVQRFCFASMLVVLASCATSERVTKKSEPTRHDKKIEQLLSDNNNGEAVDAPAEVTSENVSDLPPSDSSAQAEQELPPIDARAPFFAVWIDSYGFDSYAALAFLQELEKSGHKPVKIVGTGLGCWVAQSWALSNSGNRAEWQASKWNDWQQLRAGFLGRLTGSNQSKFEEGVLKLTNIRNWSQFQLPVDCPLLKKQTPYVLESGLTQNPETAFWISLQLGLFGASEDQLSRSGYFAGSLAGAPSEAEMLELSKELKSSSEKRFVGWLVLSTRPRLKQGAQAAPYRQLLAGRSSQWPQKLRSQNSSEPEAQVKILSLSPTGEFLSDDLMKTENRRRFLLQGRKNAQFLLQQDEVKNFLK